MTKRLDPEQVAAGRAARAAIRAQRNSCHKGHPGGDGTYYVTKSRAGIVRHRCKICIKEANQKRMDKHKKVAKPPQPVVIFVPDPNIKKHLNHNEWLKLYGDVKFCQNRQKKVPLSTARKKE